MNFNFDLFFQLAHSYCTIHDLWNWTLSLQVPEGPAHKHLEPGDVLVRMNDEVSNAV